MGIARVLRLGAAIALLIAGLVHLDLYFGGYRSAGSEPSFGRSILLNAIVSGVVAVAVAARRERFVRVAGIALAAGSLAAFAYTHTQHTFLGFQGDGLEPSPQATIVLVAEIAALLLLGATFLPAVAADDKSSGPIFLGAAAAVGAVALVGLGAYWAGDDGATTAAAGPSSVTIADFAFTPRALTVERGTTVTWTNGDSFDHSVVVADGSFSSDPLDSGAAVQFRFATPGQHAYACGIHPSMTGTVTVTE